MPLVRVPKKVLYILRNPVDRIELHLAHRVSHGVRDLSRALASGNEILAHPIALSSYAMQLGRYRAAMPYVLIQLVALDDVRDDQVTVLERIRRFVGVDPLLDFGPPKIANTRRSAHVLIKCR